MSITQVSIGFSRGRGLVSALIRRLTKSAINHVYYRFEFVGAPSLIYESHMRGGVQITPYKQLERALVEGRVEWLWEHPLMLSSSDREELWDRCSVLHGSAYDRLQILLYYLRLRLGLKRRGLVMSLNRKGKFTCNELVLAAGRGIVDGLAGADMSWTPEDIFLRLMQCPSKVLYFRSKKRNED